MKQLTHAERNQYAKDAIDLIIKLLPPEEFGEDSRVEILFNCVVSLGELSPDQLDEIMECGNEYPTHP
jgi:hypothetical protein